MIRHPAVRKTHIRSHYELATLFYRLIWGVHIHHGLWFADESVHQAQQQLIDHLITTAGIPRGSRVLDVGCGMGGSAVHLAAHHDCQVTGITLSSMQRRWAQTRARLHQVHTRTRFLRQDAEALELPKQTFDWLWSIECTEHLFDKRAFLEKAAHWLRPGGGTALCIWLAGDEPQSPAEIRQVEEVCEAFLCPSLGTVQDYSQWLSEAGLTVERVDDLTSGVMRTWAICEQRMRRIGAAYLARLFGPNMLQFVENFATLYKAYESGAMKYCSIVAKKPQ